MEYLVCVFFFFLQECWLFLYPCWWSIFQYQLYIRPTSPPNESGHCVNKVSPPTHPPHPQPQHQLQLSARYQAVSSQWSSQLGLFVDPPPTSNFLPIHTGADGDFIHQSTTSDTSNLSQNYCKKITFNVCSTWKFGKFRRFMAELYFT